MIVSDVGRSALIGVAVGLATVALLASVVERLLFDVSATDPVALGTVTSALLAAAALAAWGPARTAVRIPPGEALRAE